MESRYNIVLGGGGGGRRGQIGWLDKGKRDKNKRELKRSLSQVTVDYNKKKSKA